MLKLFKEELIVLTFSQVMFPYHWRKKLLFVAPLREKILAEISANLKPQNCEI